jgi:hypothetical protein
MKRRCSINAPSSLTARAKPVNALKVEKLANPNAK